MPGSTAIVLADMKDNVIPEIRSQLNAINTDGMSGDTIAGFRQRLAAAATELEGVESAVNTIHAAVQRYDDSVVQYKANSPTDADLTAAATRYTDAVKAHDAAITSAAAEGISVDNLNTGIALSDASTALTGANQRRAAAMALFINAQAALIPPVQQISFASIPEISQGSDRSADGPGVSSGPGMTGGPGLSGGPTSMRPGSPADTQSSRSLPSTTDDSSLSSSSTASKPSLQELLANGQPTTPISPTTMPSAALQPQLPGTTPGLGNPALSAANQPKTMSNADFNQLMSKLQDKNRKKDRDEAPSTITAATTSPVPGSPNAPNAVQPASWVNAATAPTSESAAQTRTATPTGPGGLPPGTRGSGMPMMPPMMPPTTPGGVPNSSRGERPKIKNADPSVYGDDVRVTTPVVENGRTTR